MKTKEEWAQFFINAVLAGSPPNLSPRDCLELFMCLSGATSPDSAIVADRPKGLSEAHQAFLDNEVANLVRTCAKQGLCSCPKCTENRV